MTPSLLYCGELALELGFVTSVLTVSLPVFERPALSETEQVGSAARPEPASLAATVTVTGELVFQPPDPLAECVAEREGAIESWSVCVEVVSGVAGVASALSATSVAIV